MGYLNFVDLAAEARKGELSIYLINGTSPNPALLKRSTFSMGKMDLEEIANVASLIYLEDHPEMPIRILPTPNLLLELPTEPDSPLWAKHRWYKQHKNLFEYDKESGKVKRVNS